MHALFSSCLSKGEGGDRKERTRKKPWTSIRNAKKIKKQSIGHRGQLDAWTGDAAWAFFGCFDQGPEQWKCWWHSIRSLVLRRKQNGEQKQDKLQLGSLRKKVLITKMQMYTRKPILPSGTRTKIMGPSVKWKCESPVQKTARKVLFKVVKYNTFSFFFCGLSLSRLVMVFFICYLMSFYVKKN